MNSRAIHFVHSWIATFVFAVILSVPGSLYAALPGAPTNLTLHQVDPTGAKLDVDVTWVAPADSGGSPITGYTITRSTDGFSWQIDSCCSATVPVLANGLRTTFKVSAKNGSGTGPGPTAMIRVTGGPHPSDPPAAPVLSVLDKTTGLRLAWTVPAGELFSFVLETSLLPDFSGNPVAQSLATTTTTLPLPCHNLYLRIFAINSRGKGPSSNVIAFAAPAPGAPTNLTLKQVDPTGAKLDVDLAWDAPADNGWPVLGYTVRRMDGMTWNIAGTSARLAVSANGQPTTFIVSAKNICPGPAVEASITTIGPPPPAKPVTAPVLSLTSRTRTTIALAWTASEGSPDYLLDISPDPGFGNESGTAGVGPATSANYPVTCDDRYFRVLGRNSVGTSPRSNVVTSDCPCPAGVTKPGPPTHLTVKQVDRTGARLDVDLAWAAPTQNGGSPIIGYTITRSTDGFKWEIYSRHTARLPVEGNKVPTSFTVAAKNQCQTGPATTASITTTGPTPPPKASTPPASPVLSVTSRTPDAVTLVWTAPAGEVTAYRIERSLSANFSGTLVSAISDLTTTYVWPIPCKQYYFRIVARNSMGQSAYSNVIPSLCPATRTP